MICVCVCVRVCVCGVFSCVCVCVCMFLCICVCVCVGGGVVSENVCAVFMQRGQYFVLLSFCLENVGVRR